MADKHKIFLDPTQIHIREPQDLGDITLHATEIPVDALDKGVPARRLEVAEIKKARLFPRLGSEPLHGQDDEVLSRRLYADARQQIIQRDGVVVGPGERHEQPPEHTGAVSSGFYETWTVSQFVSIVTAFFFF
jgi:hypothetical protein